MNLGPLLAFLTDPLHRPLPGFAGNWRQVRLKLPSLRRLGLGLGYGRDPNCRAARRATWRRSWLTHFSRSRQPRRYRRQAWLRSW